MENLENWSNEEREVVVVLADVTEPTHTKDPSAIRR